MNKLYKSWSLYEITWLTVFSIFSIVVTVVNDDSLFGFTVFLSGVICVVLAAKGNIWTYFFGTYNTFTYAYIAYLNSLYGELGLYLLFFAPMNIVGFLMWRNKLTANIVVMRKLNIYLRLLVVCICLIGTALLGFLLSQIATQNSPYIDASTTVLSVVATILMVQRYKEQWLVYITLNILTITLWVIRHINGSGEGAIMVVMWSAFLVNSFYGYYNWSKGANRL